MTSARLRRTPEYKYQVREYAKSLVHRFGREVAKVFADDVSTAEQLIQVNRQIGRVEPYLIDEKLVELSELTFRSGPKEHQLIYIAEQNNAGGVDVWMLTFWVSGQRRSSARIIRLRP
jgi:plasmid stabilization system protein ParE